MNKNAIIHFYNNSISVRSCAGIEIVPGQVKLLNEKGEVMERYASRYIKAFTFDNKEFPLLPDIRKDKYL